MKVTSYLFNYECIHVVYGTLVYILLRTRVGSRKLFALLGK